MVLQARFNTKLLLIISTWVRRRAWYRSSDESGDTFVNGRIAADFRETWTSAVAVRRSALLIAELTTTTAAAMSTVIDTLMKVLDRHQGRAIGVGDMSAVVLGESVIAFRSKRVISRSETAPL
jgi:hypothetical protein